MKTRPTGFNLVLLICNFLLLGLNISAKDWKYSNNNNLGVGKCIEGTASGPNDIYKYNFCKLNSSGSNNSYTHGGNLEFNMR